MYWILSASQPMVEEYWRLFVNRPAYTRQSMKPHARSRRHYFYQPKERGSDAPLELTKDAIRQHLEGRITIGLYAINPANQRCKWIVIDADYKNALQDLLKLQYRLTQDRVEPALEMSRRGGHLWIFLATPLLARDCRLYIHDLASALGIPIKASAQVDGIEIFPKQNAIGPGEFGSAMRGPLGVHRGADRRFWFYGAASTLAAQLTYLNSLRKLTEEEMRALIAGKDALPRASKPANGRRHGGAVGFQPAADFNILQHVGQVRKVGRNYVARCPACAAAGRDRSGDNLAVMIKDSRFYKCWAGCTKEMIRSAMGWPVSSPRQTWNQRDK